jgi:hypothetical protein
MNPLLAVLFFAAGMFAGALACFYVIRGLWSRALSEPRAVRVHAFVSQGREGHVEWSLGAIRQQPLIVELDPHGRSE